ncbi:hypothetical protein [Oscillibacter sp.]|uniref:hypothetical protein n=1 Tax=Oscillibacter sp. TaxID=1945593 RepID=UPI002897334E|nr:hypothetical protein [Oscillibacter sp.]
MSFKKLRGVSLPEEKQGLVRFTCLNEQVQPKKTQEKIQRLCDKCGGAYSAALREVMCTKKSISGVAMKYHVSESVLYRARKEFYEGWFGLWRGK